MSLQSSIQAYNERLSQDFINGIPRWEYYGVQRRIAQAACNYGGYIVTGTRHFCPIMSLQIDAIGESKLMSLIGDGGMIIEGFTCQYGHFLTRKEAYVIAKAANQIINNIDSSELYSECYI